MLLHLRSQLGLKASGDPVSGLTVPTKGWTLSLSLWPGLEPQGQAAGWEGMTTEGSPLLYHTLLQKGGYSLFVRDTFYVCPYVNNIEYIVCNILKDKKRYFMSTLFTLSWKIKFLTVASKKNKHTPQ